MVRGRRRLVRACAQCVRDSGDAIAIAPLALCIIVLLAMFGANMFEARMMVLDGRNQSIDVDLNTQRVYLDGCRELRMEGDSLRLIERLPPAPCRPFAFTVQWAPTPDQATLYKSLFPVHRS